MQESWLNPDFATHEIVIVVVIFLASMVILPVVFGTLIYTLFGILSRLMDARRAAQKDAEPDEES